MTTGDQPRVLVIEDDPDTQSNLRDILEMDGYEVECAATVRETLLPRDWGALFAIVLDRRLPDGSADSLLPSIRELAPDAAIIVVTGTADLEGAIGVIRHGIADFIPKPIDPEMLRASLARTIRMREIEEKSRQDERLATIGRMMASVAHESRNALQRISAAADMLELSLDESGEDLGDVRKIRSAAGDLHQLLEEIRGYASPFNLRRSEVRLATVWKTAWGEVMETIDRDHRWDSRHAILDDSMADEFLSARVDPFRLQQVFRNLFENSIAAVAPAPIQIRLATKVVRRAGLTMYRILLQDNGPGIPEAQRDQLFEPFFTTKPEGTGLGLAISQRIINAHGGRIFTVASSRELNGSGRSLQPPGSASLSGAIFVVDLPATQAEGDESHGTGI
ncbi:MAG: ATP-binding protein [Planctomycetota bacterium]